VASFNAQTPNNEPMLWFRMPRDTEKLDWTDTVKWQMPQCVSRSGQSFLGRMTHDLQTPAHRHPGLRQIAGNQQLLRRQDPADLDLIVRGDHWFLSHPRRFGKSLSVDQSPFHQAGGAVLGAGHPSVAACRQHQCGTPSPAAAWVGNSCQDIVVTSGGGQGLLWAPGVGPEVVGAVSIP